MRSHHIIFGLVAAIGMPFVNGVAVPDSELPKCRFDQCQQEVFVGPRLGGIIVAIKDCSSFFEATVTPTPVTKTVTSTFFSTAPEETLIGLEPVPNFITVTDYIRSTIVVNLETTVLTTVHTTVTLSETIATKPIPITYVTTASAVAPTAAPTVLARKDSLLALAKRFLGLTLHPRYHGQLLQARAGASVPPYAPACSGAAAYSSACSCLGVSHFTTTLHTSTVTSTAVVTDISTPDPTVIYEETSLSFFETVAITVSDVDVTVISTVVATTLVANTVTMAFTV